MGTYFKKNFLICLSLLSPQAEEKKDDEHFANNLQMHVSRAPTKAKNLHAQNTQWAQNSIHPNGKYVFLNLLINSLKLI